jgi:hypothetical protein
MLSNSEHIHYHDNIEQGTDEWLALRENKISGSTAYKLLGKGVPSLKSFNSASENTFTGNYATRRGHMLEPEAIELYEEIHGVKVQHTGLVTNDKYPNAVYSPDGYLDDRTIEVKCFLPKNHLATIKRQDLKILAQCYFGQVILEKDSTDLILYCPKDEIELKDKYVEIQIPKKEKVHANIISRMERVR